MAKPTEQQPVAGVLIDAVIGNLRQLIASNEPVLLKSTPELVKALQTILRVSGRVSFHARAEAKKTATTDKGA